MGTPEQWDPRTYEHDVEHECSVGGRDWLVVGTCWMESAPAQDDAGRVYAQHVYGWAEDVRVFPGESIEPLKPPDRDAWLAAHGSLSAEVAWERANERAWLSRDD